MSSPPSLSKESSVSSFTSNMAASTGDAISALSTSFIVLPHLSGAPVMEAVDGTGRPSHSSEASTVSPAITDAMHVSPAALVHVSRTSTSGSYSGEEAEQLQQEKREEVGSNSSSKSNAHRPEHIAEAESQPHSNNVASQSSDAEKAPKSSSQAEPRPSEATSPASNDDSQRPVDTTPLKPVENYSRIEQRSPSEDAASAHSETITIVSATNPAERDAVHDEEQTAHNGIGAEATPKAEGEIEAATQGAPPGAAEEIRAEVDMTENASADAQTASNQEEAAPQDETANDVPSQTNFTFVTAVPKVVPDLLQRSPDTLARVQKMEKKNGDQKGSGTPGTFTNQIKAESGKMECNVAEAVPLRNEEPTEKEATLVSSPSANPDVDTDADTVVKNAADESPWLSSEPSKLPEKKRKRRRAPLAGPARTQSHRSGVREGKGGQLTTEKESVVAVHRLGDASPSISKHALDHVTVNEEEAKTTIFAEVKETIGRDQGDVQAIDNQGTAVSVIKTSNTVVAQAGSNGEPLPQRAKREFHADVRADTNVFPPPPLATTIAERVTRVSSDAESAAFRSTPGQQKLSSSTPDTTSSELPMKSTQNDASTKGNKRAAAVPGSSSPVTATSTSTTSRSPRGQPSSSVFSTKPVLNIAGVNVQALLAENSAPPPLYFRRQRRTRRKSAVVHNSIFEEHRDLCRHDQTHGIIARAPFASDADVLNSLVEWKDSPALVYARLLWRYAPHPFLQAAMYGLNAPAGFKPEPKSQDTGGVLMKKEVEEG